MVVSSTWLWALSLHTPPTYVSSHGAEHALLAAYLRNFGHWLSTCSGPVSSRSFLHLRHRTTSTTTIPCSSKPNRRQATSVPLRLAPVREFHHHHHHLCTLEDRQHQLYSFRKTQKWFKYMVYRASFSMPNFFARSWIGEAWIINTDICRLIRRSVGLLLFRLSKFEAIYCLFFSFLGL